MKVCFDALGCIFLFVAAILWFFAARTKIDWAAPDHYGVLALISQIERQAKLSRHAAAATSVGLLLQIAAGLVSNW